MYWGNDRVKYVIECCASKVGGTAKRYQVVSQGKETVFYEDKGKWFVEAICRAG